MSTPEHKTVVKTPIINFIDHADGYLFRSRFCHYRLPVVNDADA
jgi:hypothetical protein